MSHELERLLAALYERDTCEPSDPRSGTQPFTNSSLML